MRGLWSANEGNCKLPLTNKSGSWAMAPSIAAMRFLIRSRFSRQGRERRAPMEGSATARPWVARPSGAASGTFAVVAGGVATPGTASCSGGTIGWAGRGAARTSHRAWTSASNHCGGASAMALRRATCDSTRRRCSNAAVSWSSDTVFGGMERDLRPHRRPGATTETKVFLTTRGLIRGLRASALCGTSANREAGAQTAT
mmetsp:Transcript_107916/g.302247  ORF Transcript_107916/g.302247 Transcript_107916/m.302247 type:complete len:200 (+) Transcript_107916:311-910(+)